MRVHGAAGGHAPFLRLDDRLIRERQAEHVRRTQRVLCLEAGGLSGLLQDGRALPEEVSDAKFGSARWPIAIEVVGIAELGVRAVGWRFRWRLRLGIDLGGAPHRGAVRKLRRRCRRW